MGPGMGGSKGEEVVQGVGEGVVGAVGDSSGCRRCRVRKWGTLSSLLTNLHQLLWSCSVFYAHGLIVRCLWIHCEDLD